MTPALTILAADAELAEPKAAGWHLVLAALAGIALIVVLITMAKLHPFLALIFGALTVGIIAQGRQNIGDVLESFADGFGTTAAGVGRLDRAWCDVRQAACGFRRRGRNRRHHRRATPHREHCHGRWRWWARSSACRCSSRSGWCC